MYLRVPLGWAVEYPGWRAPQAADPIQFLVNRFYGVAMCCGLEAPIRTWQSPVHLDWAWGNPVFPGNLGHAGEAYAPPLAGTTSSASSFCTWQIGHYVLST